MDVVREGGWVGGTEGGRVERGRDGGTDGPLLALAYFVLHCFLDLLTTSTSNRLNVGFLVLWICGGIAILVLIVAFFVYHWSRYK